MSPDTLIDELDEISLLALCARYLYEPSEYDRRLEVLRETVRDGYWSGEVPAYAIRAHANAARDARIEAANRIIADNNNTIAALFALLPEDNRLQYLAVAERRDQRRDAEEGF